MNHHTYRFAGLSIVLLNLLDAVFTIVYVKAGMAVEANPLMDFFLSMGAPAFALVKLLGVGAATAFLVWAAERSGAARAALVVLAVVYFCLVMYHLSAIPV